MIRQLKVAHDTAVKDCSAAMITLKAMIVHAPEKLRTETAKKTQRMIARYCAALRPRALETPDDSIRHTLRSIAKRWLALDEEIKELVAMIEQLVVKRAPHLLQRSSSSPVTNPDGSHPRPRSRNSPGSAPFRPVQG